MSLWTSCFVYLHSGVLINDSGNTCCVNCANYKPALKIEFRASKWLVKIIDSQASPRIRAKVHFHFICAQTCHCPPVQRFAAALTHFHTSWKTGTDFRSQILIGCSLVTVDARSPRSPKAFQRVASGFWNAMFELTQACRNKQCLPRLCGKTGDHYFPFLSPLMQSSLLSASCIFKVSP